MDELARDLDIPFKRNGSLVVCTKDQAEALNLSLEAVWKNFWKKELPTACRISAS